MTGWMLERAFGLVTTMLYSSWTGVWLTHGSSFVTSIPAMPFDLGCPRPGRPSGRRDAALGDCGRSAVELPIFGASCWQKYGDLPHDLLVIRIHTHCRDACPAADIRAHARDVRCRVAPCRAATAAVSLSFIPAASAPPADIEAETDQLPSRPAFANSAT